MRKIPWQETTPQLSEWQLSEKDSLQDMENLSSPFRVTITVSFEPIAVPKHGQAFYRELLSPYAKGISISDIEEEMREIYEI